MATKTKANPGLRQRILAHDFLQIDDETSGNGGFAVWDRRPKIGGFGPWIDGYDSLAFLVKHGAEAWMESKFNGCC